VKDPCHWTSNHTTINASLYYQTLQILHNTIKNKYPNKAADSITLLHGTIHVAHKEQDQMNIKKWEMLKHPAYTM
jgi:hypothetical protein